MFGKFAQQNLWLDNIVIKTARNKSRYNKKDPEITTKSQRIGLSQNTNYATADKIHFKASVWVCDILDKKNM